MSFHFHICENCFAILKHKKMTPEPCAHHDCRNCGEEVDRNGYATHRGALEAVAALKAAAAAQAGAIILHKDERGISLVGAWPELARVTPAALVGAKFAAIDGSVLSIDLLNGSARYRLAGHDRGDMILRKIEATLEEAAP